MRFLKKRNQLVSALSPLSPASIIDTTTGEYVSADVLKGKLNLLSAAVFAETNRLYELHKLDLFEQLETYNGTPSPAEFARQKGYSTNFTTTLPREVKAKSRLEKLVQYKLVSEVGSYVANPTRNKQEPTFNTTLSLGAVDKQMASLSWDEGELNLLWKCWDKEYYLTFTLPAYVLQRKIVKFSLPLIRRNKDGQYEFIFAVFEQAQQRKGNAHTVGIDLGIVKPYSMAVVNKKGQRVASYEATARLIRLSEKRQRLLAEQKQIRTKIANRTTRGLSSPFQELELQRTSAKSTRLTKTIAQQTGSEIARKLAKHNSNLIHLENLTWVSGHSGSKIGSSRWSHSQQQEAVTHATARIGYKVKKVSARNTSQTCHRCGKSITHNAQKRSVWCVECKVSLDRDFNAAMNIAGQRSSIFPVSKKLNGGTTGDSGVTQLGKEAFSGTLVNLPLARTTT